MEDAPATATALTVALGAHGARSRLGGLLERVGDDLGIEVEVVAEVFNALEETTERGEEIINNCVSPIDGGRATRQACQRRPTKGINEAHPIVQHTASVKTQ